MLGPVINAAVIFVCSIFGAFCLRAISVRFEEIIKKAIGLSVLFIGIKGALETQNTLLLIMSLVIGAIFGEAINIDFWINRAGEWIERKTNKPDKETLSSGAANTDISPTSTAGDSKTAVRNFSKAFVSASILFCSGAMAIVGSMESGLKGRHDIIYAKSVLDGAISLVFAASMGIGTAFSALSVLIYQGGIAFAAIILRDFFSEDMIREMSASGSLVIAAIGVNFLGFKEIKVANLIPAAFIPLLYYGILKAFF
jgi:uncharacterized membrane protein YqgA involved in biofilm formation